MSHYNVNASVPKTLIRFLMRWAINANLFGEEANEVLDSVVETAISPELVPAARMPTATAPSRTPSRPSGHTSSRTSSCTTSCASATAPARWRSSPSTPGGTATAGDWPDLIPDDQRNEYSLAEIRHWLEVFLVRFFKTSQFKRSAMPNGPKVGSGGSLSPRSDWRAPSDGDAAAWLQELRDGVPEE